ncbi:hypothetical protein VIBNISO65_1700010 [Vibrio nigripulchritudo SO65]|nr:hypothetical protein VIBNISO65_1700010 [Vibrio nigripulchritudo SO65]
MIHSQSGLASKTNNPIKTLIPMGILREGITGKVDVFGLLLR